MSDTIITVEKLSKSYLIGHRSSVRSYHNYTALRDVIGREARNFARKAVDVVRGRQVVQGDSVEEFWALQDVNFELKRGETLGIIGRNGAGKSTLLKILSRITEPTHGRVVLRGRVASLLEVGTGFHPELTGRENIFLNGAILGMTRREIQAKFDEIVAFAEVDQFLDTPVKRYSSGMYVRLAFAVAAHLEPEILIVDEVLAVGDAEFQRKCLGKMSEVARGGRTVLFVSHNHTAIRSLCSHCIILRSGKNTPKQDVLRALDQYAFDKDASVTALWERPTVVALLPALYFKSINIKIEGKQPVQRLVCGISIQSDQPSRRAGITVDILDRTGVAIMQAEPRCEPFVGGSIGTYRLDLTIDLPPLVPGAYFVSFWMGPHNTETFDFVPRAVQFEVLESPTPGRTFPHSYDHGSIVPFSKISVQVTHS